jgi:hypothetical protein
MIGSCFRISSRKWEAALSLLEETARNSEIATEKVARVVFSFRTVCRIPTQDL